MSFGKHKLWMHPFHISICGLLFLTSITTSFQYMKMGSLFVALQQFTYTSVQQMICISKSAFLDSGVVLCQALR